MFDDTENKILHEKAINENMRADLVGQWIKVRDIYAQAGGVSSILHGSGIFYREEGHVLCIDTRWTRR